MQKESTGHFFIRAFYQSHRLPQRNSLVFLSELSNCLFISLKFNFLRNHLIKPSSFLQHSGVNVKKLFSLSLMAGQNKFFQASLTLACKVRSLPTRWAL